MTGEVRLRLDGGRCWVVGRRSPVSLYDYGLATYDAADTFRHQDAEGFVRLWGLGVATWSAVQEGRGAQGSASPDPAPPGPPSAVTRDDAVAGEVRGGTADVVMEFSASLAYDRLLAADDLAGSRAHVRGLGRGGLLDRRR